MTSELRLTHSLFGKRKEGAEKMVALGGGGFLLSRARSSSGSLLLLHHQHSVLLRRATKDSHRGFVFYPNESRPPACRGVPSPTDRCSFNGPLHPLVLRVPFCSSTEPPSPALERHSKVAGPKISFCPACGGATEHRIPQGEEKPRAVCTDCGRIHYENPKMVVGCIVVHEDKVLLCKRSIEPSYGLWTLPAGYMELGESAAEGAIRETWEEANADVDVQAPFAQLDIPQIGQNRAI